MSVMWSCLSTNHPNLSASLASKLTWLHPSGSRYSEIYAPTPAIPCRMLNTSWFSLVSCSLTPLLEFHSAFLAADQAAVFQRSGNTSTLLRPAWHRPPQFPSSLLPSFAYLPLLRGFISQHSSLLSSHLLFITVPLRCEPTAGQRPWCESRLSTFPRK